MIPLYFMVIGKLKKS